MVFEQDDQQLVLDPGSFSKQLPELNNVVGIIVTHEHMDHLSADNLQVILSANPGAPLYAPQDVLDQLSQVQSNKVPAKAGEKITLGAFKIQFVGGKHATIYKTSPCENVGVLVNDSFYTPGDSLDKPQQQIKVLAVPASAPWMKASETMDFIAELKPEVVFPVHDMLLSDIGESVTYRWLKQAAESVDADWQILATGQSLTIE